MTARRRVAILISGRGSNMAALIEAARDPAYPAEIVLVISNRAEAKGLAYAAEQGVPVITVDHQERPNRAAFDDEVDRLLRAHDVDLVCLAGFMRILSDGFVESWSGRMLNIHPSLLPLFRGLHPHRQALEAGVCLHGCTVHFVTPELDGGPIVAQAAVPVLAGDTDETLAERVLGLEHQLYPLGLSLVADGTVRFEDGRTVCASEAVRALGLAYTPSSS